MQASSSDNINIANSLCAGMAIIHKGFTMFRVKRSFTLKTNACSIRRWL
jgi:hypothetical protein